MKIVYWLENLSSNPSSSRISPPYYSFQTVSAKDPAIAWGYFSVGGGAQLPLGYSQSTAFDSRGLRNSENLPASEYHGHAT